MSTSKVTQAATQLGLSDDRLSILLHALGIQKRGVWKVGGWRNYYSTSLACDSYGPCRELERDGWMRGRAHGSQPDSWIFNVTPAAIAALRLAGWKIEEQPK